MQDSAILLLVCTEDAEDPKEDAQHHFGDAQSLVIPAVHTRGRQSGTLEDTSEANGQLCGLGSKLRAQNLEQPLVHMEQERHLILLPFWCF